MKNNLIILLLFCLPFVSISQEKSKIETEVIIPTNSVTIKGTLLTLGTDTKQPLVIIIPGSGPTDRNGNNAMMKNNSLKLLAENLSNNNISTFRYDKSVLSYSSENIENLDSLTFDTFINEAKTVIEFFKKSNNYSKIIIAGHSQGSLVGLLASQNKADGFISLAGAGRSIDNILIEQISKQAPFLKEETERVLVELKKGNIVEDYNELLKSLFNKKTQPFLISWIHYNPKEEIKKLTIPVLIINGTNDIQVGVNEAELLHKNCQSSQLYIIENMNHLFKEIKGDINENMLSYNNPNLPVMEELINIITTFVNEIK
jgi:pimeloyl-ACP methyl ester carboxylesterase